MTIATFIAALLLSVPSLSHANVDRLISRYVADNSPEIYVLLNRPMPDPLYAALARAGILHVVGSGVLNCGPTSPAYNLTAYGLRFAKTHGWKIHEVAPGMYEGVEIPLGSFALVHDAISIRTQANQPARVTFSYWFHGNANVSYLLSLAPPSVWGSVGMNDGRGVTLDQAGRLLSETLSVSRENASAGVVRYIAPSISICN